MSFQYQALHQLRKKAALVPLPRFLSDYGHMLEHDEDAQYINNRYFSPEALHWADAVVEYRAHGGTLSKDDEECFARVWRAMRAGRSTTDQQLRAFHLDRKWRQAEARIPELYALEMKQRGVKCYGPDYELADDVPGPGSGEELVYRYLYSALGYKNRQSAKANHKEWKRKRRAAHGMH